MLKKSKKALSMPQEFTGWFIWGIIVLVFIFIISMVIRGKLTDGIDYFRGLLRFGRG
jgi:nitrogen fixation protein FixH